MWNLGEGGEGATAAAAAAASPRPHAAADAAAATTIADDDDADTGGECLPPLPPAMEWREREEWSRRMISPGM